MARNDDGDGIGVRFKPISKESQRKGPSALKQKCHNLSRDRVESRVNRIPLRPAPR